MKTERPEGLAKYSVCYGNSAGLLVEFARKSIPCPPRNRVDSQSIVNKYVKYGDDDSKARVSGAYQFSLFEFIRPRMKNLYSKDSGLIDQPKRWPNFNGDRNLRHAKYSAGFICQVDELSDGPSHPFRRTFSIYPAASREADGEIVNSLHSEYC